MAKEKVLVADDDQGVIWVLEKFLKEKGHEVAVARNGTEAARELKAGGVALALLDINMPELNGLEATRAIKTELPETKIVILTVSDDEQDLFEAIKSGAEGYLLKNLHEEEFAQLVENLKIGEPAMSPGLARRLLREFARLKEDEPLHEVNSTLTAREQDVLELVAKGASNREIGASLFISENTANFHMKNILSKLHLRNRSQVVAWAIEHGFTSKPGIQ